MHKHYENWLRVVALIDYAGKRLCHEILHIKEGLPLDGENLYRELEIYKDDMHFEIYEEILCPPDKVIDENKFDLLVYTIVIYHRCGARYKKLLDEVGDLRNEVFHMQDESICTADFQELWRKAYDMLCNYDCDYDFDTESLNFFKNCDLFSLEVYKGILEVLLFS